MCIAAQLGEKDRAVELRRDASAQGYEFSIGVHGDPDLKPLYGYPPPQGLMNPKA